MTEAVEAIHLRAGGTSVVIDAGGVGLPVIGYWGADLGEVSAAALDGLVVASRPERVSGGLDFVARPSVLPGEAEGWLGAPGLVGSRQGRDFSPAFVLRSLSVEGASCSAEFEAPDERLELRWWLEVDAAGLVRQRLRLRNLDERDYRVDSLAASFPIPTTATEVLDTSGRHLRERHPQRHALTIGSYTRRSRGGRPGADATLLLMVGEPGFGFERGLVHGVHLAWSGDHALELERTPGGITVLQAAEVLGPGELVLAPGEHYETPEAIGSWGDGLNELSARFHRALRARPTHPQRPRPVTINSWEAMYFDLDDDALADLADRAAAVGAERFVLDDGWFLGRRDDTAGLGDWIVDPAVFPRGLGPIIEHVRGLGMEFGLWVEPEMVNPDSELARAHPDWMLGAGTRTAPSARQQQVLDLGRPEVAAYLLERLDALLTEYPIGYLKWDHNRDLIEAGSRADGRRAVHRQTLALYRLLDELRLRHPGLEIEACASGGARIDLGILERTDRVWTSDCIDPIERLTIQKYTGLLLPPELMGMHIGDTPAHSTGRATSFELRAATALSGHLGIEWDLRRIGADDLAVLREWVAWHRELRDFLHTSVTVYADLVDPGAELRGQVAADASRALYVFTQVVSASAHPAAAITLPGLDPEAEYLVRLTGPGQRDGWVGQSELEWASEGVVLSGRMLATAGLRPPTMFPARVACISAERL